MIEKLIEASIRNRFLVLILAVGLSVAGVYAVFDTPIDAKARRNAWFQAGGLK